MREKKNYVNNANLLAEIHKSKLTYCYYEEQKYTDYDIICSGYDMITPNQIDTFFKKNKNRDYVIVRVMTTEHVMPYIVSNKINLQELKFNPFKHYMISREDHQAVINSIDEHCVDNINILNDNIAKIKDDIKENNRRIRFYKNKKEEQAPYKEIRDAYKNKILELNDRIKDINIPYSERILSYMKEVLRSHWKNGFDNGEFCISQGRLTNNLVRMIMLMVDKYGTSGNWSGYSYIEDMKCASLAHLCEVALKFEELISKNPFSYYTQAISMKFTAVVNQEKRQAGIKSDLLQMNGYRPTFEKQAEFDMELAEMNQ